MNNMYNTVVTSENFVEVLNSMRAIVTDRPLTPVEKALGRKAALFQKEFNAREARKSIDNYRQTLIDFHLGQGYSLSEAQALIIQSERCSLENNGFGISRKAN